MQKQKTILRFLKNFQSLFLLGLMTLVAASCSDVDFNGPKSGPGHIDFHLTDAPGDYDEVNIDVQGLRIHYTPNSGDTTDSSSGKWIDLPVEPQRINLLELTNGVDMLLSSADMDPGKYRELRLILGADNDVVIDGEAHNLKVPSGQQSGYKIKFSTELESEEDLDVLIDFDAARSVHMAGKSGKYILKPVLKAFVTNAEEAETGSVVGIVEPTDANATVYAIMGDDTTGSTQPSEDGAFTLVGLDEGVHDLSIQPASEAYIEASVDGVNIEAGEETNVGTITLQEDE